jgi:hypothetical protein
MLCAKPCRATLEGVPVAASCKASDCTGSGCAAACSTHHAVRRPAGQVQHLVILKFADLAAIQQVCAGGGARRGEASRGGSAVQARAPQGPGRYAAGVIAACHPPLALVPRLEKAAGAILGGCGGCLNDQGSQASEWGALRRLPRFQPSIHVCSLISSIPEPLVPFMPSQQAASTNCTLRQRSSRLLAAAGARRAATEPPCTLCGRSASSCMQNLQGAQANCKRVSTSALSDCLTLATSCRPTRPCLHPSQLSQRQLLLQSLAQVEHLQEQNLLLRDHRMRNNPS